MIKLIASEAQEQMAYMEWAQFNNINILGWNFQHQFSKLSEWVFHIPNGELRDVIIGKKLKKMGVKAGVADLFIMLPKGRWHGMFIELKRRAASTKPSPAQLKFATLAKQAGYWYYVAYGWEDAKQATLEYLDGE